MDNNGSTSIIKMKLYTILRVNVTFLEVNVMRRGNRIFRKYFIGIAKDLSLQEKNNEFNDIKISFLPSYFFFFYHEFTYIFKVMPPKMREQNDCIL